MLRIKNKIEKVIARNRKKKTSSVKAALNAFWSERIALFAALFFFSFGMGLIADGKKIYTHQLKLSQTVNYKANLKTN